MAQSFESWQALCPQGKNGTKRRSRHYSGATGAGEDVTPAEFYRDEAARCVRRAEASRTPERRKKWHELADEYLRLALLMEDSETSGRQAPMRVSTQFQTVQQQQSELVRAKK
jgi:hypothetical protein